MAGNPLGSVLDAVAERSFWMPPNASTTTEFVDPVFYYILALTTLFFVVIVLVGIYFAIRYRKRSDADRTHPTAGNHKIEAILAIIPSILLATIFWLGFQGYMNLAVAPADAMEIRVTGQKWFWTFEYPSEGVKIIASPDETKRRADELQRDTGLVVPLGQAVKLIGNSRDVLHSMFVPAFRIKKDVIPNRYTAVWFEATEVGEYHFFCTEYCGKDHSRMLSKVIVMTPEDYATWMAEERELSTAPKDGRALFGQAGCAACHSLTGDAGVGPTFKGLFGRVETMTDGSTLTVDDNYIRESIMDPTAKVVEGFGPVMPPYAGQFEDAEVDALIDFIKSQK